MVADYCFVRSSADQSLLVLMVAKLGPSLAICAIPCDVKGSDDYCVHRLCNFVRGCGVQRMAYLCDQESSTNEALQATCKALKVEGDWQGAVPENSAVGESQSNGRAEQDVQFAEDQMRTLRVAIEDCIQARIPSTNPMSLWMAEYVGVLLTNICSGRRWRHSL